MGYVRPEYKTPKKSRFFYLLEQGKNIPATARELKVNLSTAWRWTRRFYTDEPKCTTRKRLAVKPLGRPHIVTDEHIKQMIQWITGHYDRRILPLETITKKPVVSQPNT